MRTITAPLSSSQSFAAYETGAARCVRCENQTPKGVRIMLPSHSNIRVL